MNSELIRFKAQVLAALEKETQLGLEAFKLQCALDVAKYVGDQATEHEIMSARIRARAHILEQERGIEDYQSLIHRLLASTAQTHYNYNTAYEETCEYFGVCPRCRQYSLVSSGHGPYCGEPHCRWGWDY